MGADFNKPTTSDHYATGYTPGIRDNLQALAKALDPAKVTAANLPVDTIVWSSANKRWERWSGATFVNNEPAGGYAINISGNAATATQAGYAVSAGAADSATNAANASNIAGGSGGQLLYQSSAGITSKLANGTAGQLLAAGGGTAAPVWVAPPSFPSGTRMLFQQTSAPTGWTKDTTQNDKALRVVSGTVGSGGSVAFSTAFGRQATDGHTLTMAQMPSHTHPAAVPTGFSGSGSLGNISDPAATLSSTDSQGSTAYSGSLVSGAGGSSAHAHNIDLRVQYVDLIIATKD